jgi:hypothetical protein
MNETGTANEPSAEPTSRWPLTVGMIGAVIGVIMLVDQVDDLLGPVFWTAEEWRRLVGQELADFLVRTMPARGWMVAKNLAGMALGVLLVVGSLRLRRRRRSGVTLCRTWAGLAIAWLAVQVAWVTVWFSRHAAEIPGLPPEGWQGTTLVAVVLALAVLLAWPVALLTQLARPRVREEVEGWPH